MADVIIEQLELNTTIYTKLYNCGIRIVPELLELLEREDFMDVFHLLGLTTEEVLAIKERFIELGIPDQWNPYDYHSYSGHR